MAKKKTKTERRNSAIKGWKTRRKNVKNEKTKKHVKRKTEKKKSKEIAKKTKTKKPSVKKHEPKKPTRLSISKASTKKGTVKKPALRKTKSAGKATPKRRARTVKRATKTTKKKKTKKSTRAIRAKSNRSSKSKEITRSNKNISTARPTTKSNRTYFVTVKLASEKHERKRPLNVIVWARDGLKDQEVIELLWAMIKRRKDKNLTFALDMEVKELIVAHGPLTDRLQGYQQN